MIFRFDKINLASAFAALVAALSAVSLGGCGGSAEQSVAEEESVAGLSAEPFAEPDVDVPGGKLTADVLMSMAYVAPPAVSPDGKRAIFSVSYNDVASNYTNAKLCAVSTDGSAPVECLTVNGQLVHLPAFLANGEMACMGLTPAGDSLQLILVSPDGASTRSFTLQSWAMGYLFSPDASHVALVCNASKPYRTIASELHEDLPHANAYVFDNLGYRHWNTWDDASISQVTIAKVENGAIVDIANPQDSTLDCTPVPPFGGVEQMAWSPDGTKFAYAAKRMDGVATACSTNSDIYVYDLAQGKATNVSAHNAGSDVNPCFSADGSKLYWLSMLRDGYESDRHRIVCKDLSTGEVTDLTEGSELYVQSFVIDEKRDAIWFLADHHGRVPIFKLSLSNKEITKLTNDDASYTSLAIGAEGLVATRTSFFEPGDIYNVSIADGSAANISNLNAKTLSKIKFGKCEERWIETTDGKRMLTWVMLPPDFDPAAKYPAILYCEGGPQTAVSHSWSLCWNQAQMASDGYVVVSPSRRGTPGFGVEWCEQVSKDYGGQNMRDYLSAIDAVAAESYVDRERMGCVGSSYGGFSALWLAGHHEKRFKTFVSHAGFFNMEQMYSTTDELFYVNWEFGGPYWDSGNDIAAASYAQSPHRFVDKWDASLMLVHGEKDFRVPYEQSLGAFNAAKLRGLEAKMLLFPNECHWIESPQNLMVWHREVTSWLDSRLK